MTPPHKPVQPPTPILSTLLKFWPLVVGLVMALSWGANEIRMYGIHQAEVARRDERIR